MSQAAPPYAYTHIRSDGDRLAEGSIWMVMLEDGVARRLVVSGATVVQVGIEPATLEAGALLCSLFLAGDLWC